MEKTSATLLKEDKIVLESMPAKARPTTVSAVFPSGELDWAALFGALDTFGEPTNHDMLAIVGQRTAAPHVDAYRKAMGHRGVVRVVETAAGGNDKLGSWPAASDGETRLSIASPAAFTTHKSLGIDLLTEVFLVDNAGDDCGVVFRLLSHVSKIMFVPRVLAVRVALEVPPPLSFASSGKATTCTATHLVSQLVDAYSRFRPVGMTRDGLAVFVRGDLVDAVEDLMQPPGSRDRIRHPRLTISEILRHWWVQSVPAEEVTRWAACVGETENWPACDAMAKAQCATMGGCIDLKPVEQTRPSVANVAKMSYWLAQSLDVSTADYCGKAVEPSRLVDSESGKLCGTYMQYYLAREAILILDWARMMPMLSCGSLMGATRSKTFIPWTRDVDLFTWNQTSLATSATGFASDKVNEAFFRKHLAFKAGKISGGTVYVMWTNPIARHRRRSAKGTKNGYRNIPSQYIDIYSTLFSENSADVTTHRCTIPSNEFLPRKTTTMYGYEFPVPNQSAAILNRMYGRGTWERPNKNGMYAKTDVCKALPTKPGARMDGAAGQWTDPAGWPANVFVLPDGTKMGEAVDVGA